MRKFYLQANDKQDLVEWVAVLNNATKITVSDLLQLSEWFVSSSDLYQEGICTNGWIIKVTGLYWLHSVTSVSVSQTYQWVNHISERIESVCDWIGSVCELFGWVNCLSEWWFVSSEWVASNNNVVVMHEGKSCDPGNSITFLMPWFEASAALDFSTFIYLSLTVYCYYNLSHMLLSN